MLSKHGFLYKCKVMNFSWPLRFQKRDMLQHNMHILVLSEALTSSVCIYSPYVPILEFCI